MDEFAEFEQEILRKGANSKDPLKDCLNLLEKGELDADYTISMEYTIYTPAKKCGLLALGVILIAIILPMLVGIQLNALADTFQHPRMRRLTEGNPLYTHA